MSSEPQDVSVEHESEGDETCDSRPLAPVVASLTSGSGETADLEQYAATVAAGHLDEALKTLVAVMKNPNRNAQVQLMAAREVINLALKRSPEAVSKQGARVFVLDRGEAAQVLAKRLGLPQ
jgi:hypothetical protein